MESHFLFFDADSGQKKYSRFVAGSYCSWSGVRCDECHVTELRLEQPQERIFLDEVGWLIWAGEYLIVNYYAWRGDERWNCVKLCETYHFTQCPNCLQNLRENKNQTAFKKKKTAFTSQDVRGQLSPELSRLHRLKSLDFGGAVALTGRIEALRNATLLESLNLSHSQVPWQ